MNNNNNSKEKQLSSLQSYCPHVRETTPGRVYEIDTQAPGQTTTFTLRMYLYIDSYLLNLFVFTHFCVLVYLANDFLLKYQFYKFHHLVNMVLLIHQMVQLINQLMLIWYIGLFFNFRLTIWK